MRTLILSALAVLAVILAGPGRAAAQSPVGDAGSSGVTQGQTNLESRLASLEDGEWSFRTHWDHGVTQRYALRVIVAHGRNSREGWQHRSLTFENRFDLARGDEYGLGVRVAYVVSAGGSPDEIDLRLIASREFLPGWEWRGNAIFEFEIGPGAQAGSALELRQQLTRDLDEMAMWGGKWTVGAEIFSDIGRLRDIDPLDSQGHVAGGCLSSSFGGGLGLRIGARFGLTEASDDYSARISLSKRF